MRIGKQQLWLGLALAHLGLVALGSAYISIGHLAGVGKYLKFYGDATGASETYGFFAPNVGGEIDAWFEIVTKEGKKRQLKLHSGSSHEADLRVADIIDRFKDEEYEDDPQGLRRSVAASLAGYLFGRNEDAKEVVVHLEHFSPVSIVDYRAGKRGQWSEIYLAKFIH